MAPLPTALLSRLLLVALALAVAALACPQQAGAGQQLFGFADSSAVYGYPGSPDPDRLAALESAAGAEVARLPIHWELVQPLPPSLGGRSYRWHRFDPYLEALRREGIKPVIVLIGAPGWARDRSLTCWGTTCPPAPDQLDEWRRFVRAVADRYPEAAAIEIWNEPNFRSSWSTWDGPDPGGYAQLFTASLRAIRASGSAARVVVGSLGVPPQSGWPKGNIAIDTFLHGFYDAVGDVELGSRVVLGIHPYPGPRERDRTLAGGQLETIMGQVRSVRDARDPRRELWATEVGASTSSGSFDQRGQASAIAAALRSLRAADDVGATMVYTVVDRPRKLFQPAEAGYGVVRRGPGFEPKRAYCRIAEIRRQPTPSGC